MEKQIWLEDNLFIPKKWTPWFDETKDMLLKDLEDITLDQVNAVDEEIYVVAENEKREAERREAELGAFIEKYCNWFKSKVQWISNIDGMISKFKNLMYRGWLIITSDGVWGRHCKLDWLNHEIGVLNLWTYRNSSNWKVSKNPGGKTDFINDYIYETNLDGMKKISSHLDDADGLIKDYYYWRRIPDSYEIKEILRKLKSEYSDVVININKANGYHDEDIAFFMLLTQCYGEFILKNDQVLKCYDNFRWLKKAKDTSTGQILIIKNK